MRAAVARIAVCQRLTTETPEMSPYGMSIRPSYLYSASRILLLQQMSRKMLSYGTSSMCVLS